MARLFISKNTEAKTIATIWNMGVESLDPDSYIELEKIVGLLCSTRSIDKKTVSIEQKVLSARKEHFSDCATNNAPAMIPGPCDCEYTKDGQYRGDQPIKEK